MDNSTVDNGIAATMHKTRVLQENLSDDQLDRRRLGEFPRCVIDMRTYHKDCPKGVSPMMARHELRPEFKA